MTSRRAMLAAWLAAPLLGSDPAQEVWDLLATMAAALAAGDAAGFLRAFDRSMAGYETLRAGVTALVAQAEVESSIDPVENAGDDRRRAVELDWSLHLVGRSGLARVSDRRTKVKCGLEKQGGKWKVVSLDPLGFFAPGEPGQIGDAPPAQRPA